MKNLLPALAIAFVFASCNNKTEQHNDSYIRAKVDSIVGSRLQEMNAKSMEDLDQRMTIEVKAKADSIIAARQAKMLKTTPAVGTATHKP
ncbi:MAG: hypothetical protein ABI378_14925 [Chitinophagaceae bacterium]